MGGKHGEGSGLGVGRPEFLLYSYVALDGSVSVLSSVSCVTEEVEIVGLWGSSWRSPLKVFLERAIGSELCFAATSW